jgi:hypothetical protein
MKFLKSILISTAGLILIFLVVELLMPGLLRTLYQIGMDVLGPVMLLLLLMVIVLSLGGKDG